MLLVSILASGTRAMLIRPQGRATVQIVALGVLVIAASALPGAVQAAFILDDFDDPAELVLPEMERDQVQTEAVGDLAALRTVAVHSSQTDPIGRVDVNLTRASHFTTQIDGQYLSNPLNRPILGSNIAYRFDGPTDLTENGANDAMFIDMAIFQGPGIPGGISVVVRDADHIFAAVVSRFSVLSDSAYTITVPFSAFGVRGGGSAKADFSTIDLLEVAVHLLSGNRDPNTNWVVQIDRIRVGPLVPEPNGDVLAFLAVLPLASCRRISIELFSKCSRI